MPYSSATDLPPAFKNQPAAVKRKGLSILNALLKDGVDEGKAIRIALSQAQKYVREHGKGGDLMKEGGEVWWDEERDGWFVGFTGTAEFFRGKGEDPTDQTLCFRTEVVTNHVDEDGEWFSDECLAELAKPASVDLLHGDSHKAAMVNPAAEVGCAFEHEIVHRDGYTVLKAEGEFDAAHPQGRWLWEKARKDPAKYKISIGGLVKAGWLDFDAVHKSGARGTEIQRINRDHYMLCRAVAARNQNTNFASVVAKAAGGEDKDRQASPDESEADKAWAGLNDDQVRRAVQRKWFDWRADQDDGEYVYGYVAELYEEYAIIQTDDGAFYRVTLKENGGDLVVGTPKEVKRKYTGKAGSCHCYVLQDADGNYDQAYVVNARARALQKHSDWEQAMPAIRTAYKALGLDWDRDASGKAISPADLAEDVREVFLVADKSDEGDQMDEKEIGVILRVARACRLVKAEDDEADADEPEAQEMDVAEMVKAALDEALKPVLATLADHGEHIAAWKADEEEADDEEEPEPEADDTDEAETDTDEESEETEDADADDEDEEEAETDETADALKVIGESVSAFGDQLSDITKTQADLAGRMKSLEKAKGISRALGESTEADADDDEEPGMEDVGVANPELIRSIDPTR